MKAFNRNAFSTIEYILLIVIVMLAFLVLQKNMQRGLNGSWAKTGQSFAFGRQYDAQKTVECAWDDESNAWYDRNCFEQYVQSQSCGSGDDSCQQKIIANCVGTGSACDNICRPTSCTATRPCGSTAGIDNCGNPCSVVAVAC